MKEKYSKAGLNYDIIIDKYPDINEYEKIVNIYLDDEFFTGLKDYLEDEDYALAKDACKGLFILAQDLCLYPLYTSLMEIYEDIEDETYSDCLKHYEQMMKVYKKIRGIFSV